RWAWACASAARADRLAAISRLEPGDVELAHLEHRLHRPLGGRGIVAREQLVEPSRDNLPRQPEPVLQPAARSGLAAAGGERVPVAVDLGLVGAVDRERDRLAELELRTTVDAGERLA